MALCSRPEYAALTPCGTCADQPDHHGRYLCSASTLYRVLAEHGQSVRRDRTRRPCRHRPPAVYADGPNQVWMWVMTHARGRVRGLCCCLYLFIDLYDRSVVGWGLQRGASAEHAALLIRSICMDHGRLSTQPLILHCDNGAVMKSVQMLATLAQPGITASFSRPRVSHDNPYAESLFRTLKTRCDCPAEGFAYPAEGTCLHQGLGGVVQPRAAPQEPSHVTPLQRRRGEDQAILQRRTQLHLEAREAHPERWHGRRPRDWREADRVLWDMARSRN